jgi:formamidopyrimidine-DNA glycosylase
MEGEVVWIAHLGMSGYFYYHPGGVRTPGAHAHVEAWFTDGSRLVYHDARRFGRMDIAHAPLLAAHPLLAGLGPEPLSADFSVKYLQKSLLARSQAVKAALMDQRLVAGVGNIYASEALYLAGVRPDTPCHRAARRAERICEAVKEVLASAIASGGSSLRDFVSIGGETGYFQHRFSVYGREGQPCLRCTGTVQRAQHAGRATYYCPKCQK